MIYEDIINRAKELYDNKHKEKRSCVEQAVNELVPVKEIVEFARNYDITKDNLIDDICKKI